MSFDPQKFFIGLMDFFSILLPDALLTYLLMGEVGPVVLGDRYARLSGTEAWAAFLLASYLFGHLVSLHVSWLDEFYDWARRYTLNTQIALLARRPLPAHARPRADLARFRPRMRLPLPVGRRAGATVHRTARDRPARVKCFASV